MTQGFSDQDPSRNGLAIREETYNDGTTALVVDVPGTVVDFDHPTHKYFDDISPIVNTIRIAGLTKYGGQGELFYLGSKALFASVDEEGVRDFSPVIDRTEPGKESRIGMITIGQPTLGGLFHSVQSVSVEYKNGLEEPSPGMMENPFANANERLIAED